MPAKSVGYGRASLAAIGVATFFAVPRGYAALLRQIHGRGIYRSRLIE
jgi:hypothetical protein